MAQACVYCGSTDLEPLEDSLQCSHCGTIQTQERAQVADDEYAEVQNTFGTQRSWRDEVGKVWQEEQKKRGKKRRKKAAPKPRPATTGEKVARFTRLLVPAAVAAAEHAHLNKQRLLAALALLWVRYLSLSAQFPECLNPPTSQRHKPQQEALTTGHEESGPALGDAAANDPPPLQDAVVGSAGASGQETDADASASSEAEPTPRVQAKRKAKRRRKAKAKAKAKPRAKPQAKPRAKPKVKSEPKARSRRSHIAAIEEAPVTVSSDEDVDPDFRDRTTPAAQIPWRSPGQVVAPQPLAPLFDEAAFGAKKLTIMTRKRPQATVALPGGGREAAGDIVEICTDDDKASEKSHYTVLTPPRRRRLAAKRNLQTWDDAREQALEALEATNPARKVVEAPLGPALLLALLWMALVNCGVMLLPIDLARWVEAGPLEWLRQDLQGLLPGKLQLQALPAGGAAGDRSSRQVVGLGIVGHVAIAVERAASLLRLAGLPLGRFDVQVLLPRLVTAVKVHEAQAVLDAAATLLRTVSDIPPWEAPRPFHHFASVARRDALFRRHSPGPQPSKPRSSPFADAFCGHPPDVLAAATVLLAAVVVAATGAGAAPPGADGCRGFEAAAADGSALARYAAAEPAARGAFWRYVDATLPATAAPRSPRAAGQDGGCSSWSLAAGRAMVPADSAGDAAPSRPAAPLSQATLARRLALCLQGPVGKKTRTPLINQIIDCALQLQHFVEKCPQLHKKEPFARVVAHIETLRMVVTEFIDSFWDSEDESE